ncbi:hypothetical protein CGCFRS4_v012615 [Colletotrichum fructicola]|nr:hypothetical protein CGCFRS4_v012615 [Colletotrichum fructicola]
MVGNDISNFSPGAELLPHTRLLLHQFFSVVGEAIYPPEICHAPDPLKSAWLQYIINDKAFFHVSLATVATCLDFFQRSEKDSEQAILHTNQAFNMINERLSGAEALSGTTIGLACMFSVQESVRGDLEKYNVHLRGLYQMIELRGGIRVFEDNLEVLQKICRTDVQYALHTNSWPRYPYMEIPKRVVEELATTQGCVPGTLSVIFQGASSVVCQLVSDIERCCFMFNDICEKRRPTLASYDFQGTLVSLCHRLVRIRLADNSTLSTVQKACLSGLACYISSLMLQFGRQRHLRCDLLRDELKGVIEEMLGDVSCSAQVRLWLLLLGSISVFELEDDSWLLPLLHLEIKTSGLQGWMQIETEMRRFPWIGSFHCPQGKAIWTKVQNLSITPS